jgi:hypothetical protein
MASGDPTRTGRTTARTLFLSDLHLGFRHARVRELNEFLHGVEAERIVLVGDIVDALSLARRAFWTVEHTQVVRTLLARQRATHLYPGQPRCESRHAGANAAGPVRSTPRVGASHRAR